MLVATGGIGPKSSTKQSQVMDLNSPNTCTNLPSFPYAIFSGAGGVLNGRPIICGGCTSGCLSTGQSHSKCTKL